MRIPEASKLVRTALADKRLRVTVSHECGEAYYIERKSLLTNHWDEIIAGPYPTIDDLLLDAVNAFEYYGGSC